MLFICSGSGAWLWPLRAALALGRLPGRMRDRRCLTTACQLSTAALAPLLEPAAQNHREKSGFTRRRMPPARAAPGRSPSRAVLAGRDAPARVRARAALRGARQALVEAELWAASGPREQSEGGRRRRAAQVGHGAASGAAPPHLFPPEAPPREPYPPEAVQRPLRGPLDRGGGRKGAHVQQRTY